MDISVRRLGPDDFDAAIRADEAAFSDVVKPEDREQARALTEWDRFFGAFDGDELCGTAGAYALEVTLPGGATVATSGVTAVGVLPTHRRRGVLRALMARQLDDVVERGEAVAVLTASEATIYRRFGYGVACTSQSIQVDRSRAVLLPRPGRGSDRGLRLLSREEAVERAPAWFDAHRRSWPGEISGPATWWPFIFGEKETWRGGGPLFVAAIDDADDRPGGYVTYRVTDGPGPDERKLQVRELVAADPDVAEQLWRYVLGVDLVTTIEADVGVDDPLRWRFTDFRALRVTGEHDFLWARVVDPAAALAARRYEREAELVVEVVDDSRPDVGGCYAVAGGPDGASCERTTAGADLVMDVAELGSLLLGGASARALGQAGRIEERTAGALAVADGFFGSTSGRPRCSTPF
jgi:predicted acetyltransferase